MDRKLIHILVDQVKKVVAVGASRVSQIDYGNMVTVALCNVAVVAHDVAFGICGQETHPAGTGILDAGIEPKGGFADAGRTDHKHVDVAGIHHCSGISRATDNDSLRKCLAIFACGSFTVLSLLPPFLRREWNVLIDLALFAFGHPAGSSMLAVADRLGFDVVEAVYIRQQRDPAEDAEHNSSNDDQSCNT